MAQTIQLKRSSVAGNIPGTSDLALGEIAINTADGAVYIKTGNDDIVAVADDGILHIDTTNSRVGIGTTSPAQKLDVAGIIQSTSTNPQVRINTSSGTGGGYLVFGDSGDDDRGWISYLHASDDMQFRVNAAERMRIHSNGAVTLNNASKLDSAVKFQVTGSSSGVTSFNSYADEIIFEHNTHTGITLATPNTQAGTLAFADPEQNAAAWIQYDHATDNMNFRAGNAERLRIDSSGKVGIGRTDPQATFDVEAPSGNFVHQITNGTEANFALRTYNHGGSSVNTAVFTQGLYYSGTENSAIRYYRGSGGSDGFLSFTSSGTERMRIDKSGNVGIGTTSPAGTLHIENSNVRSAVNSGADDFIIETNAYSGLTILSSNAAAGQIHFGDDGSTNIGMLQYWHTDNSMRFTVNASEQMRIDNSGNIGIGTTSPAYELDVKSASSSVASLRVLGNGAASELLIETTTNNANGTIKFGDTDDNDIGYIQYGHSANYLRFGTNANERMRIDSSGRVGIGTSSPGHALDVVGTGTPAIEATCTAGHFAIEASTPYDYVAKFSSTDAGAAIIIQDNSSTNHANRINVSGNVMQFVTAATTAVTIDASQQVGIGTTSPTNHINTGTFFKPDSNGKFLTLNGGANGSFIMLESSTTTDDDQVGGVYWNRTQGQADAHKQVAGIDVIQVAYGPNNVLEGGTMRFFTKPSGSGSNTPRMQIDHNGNILIGTTAIIDQSRNLTNIASYAGGTVKITSASMIRNSSNNDLFNYSSNNLTVGDASEEDAVEQLNLTTMAGVANVFIDGNNEYVGFFGTGNSSWEARIASNGTMHLDSTLTQNSGSIGSDIKLKKNIQPIESALDTVEKLRGVHFEWKKSGKEAIGFIAQEVEEILPQLVQEADLLGEEDETFKSLDYVSIIPILVEAIKEQQEEIEQLKKHSHPAKDMCDMKGYEELVARIEKMEKNYGNN